MAKRVLIVEDDENIRTLLRLLLVRLKFDILEAFSGAKAHDVVRGGNLDLIITDLSMPGVDGTQLIQLVRADEKMSKTPIIVVTGAHLEKRNEAAQAGADFVLLKPITRRELVRAIEAITLPEVPSQPKEKEEQ